MKRFRVTALAPVRYAFWPAAAQRHVGRRLCPGESLELTAIEYRNFRAVREQDGAERALQICEIDVENPTQSLPTPVDAVSDGSAVVSEAAAQAVAHERAA